MTGWTKVADGWAINLDGSDAAAGFSLPRLETRASPRGWRSVCFLADGGCSERAEGSADSAWAAKAAAVELAGHMLGPAHADALASLREPGFH
jgi:hypothetical protein